MPVRELSPEERPRPKPNVAVVERPRVLALTLELAPESPLVGQTIDLTITLTDLESVKPPLKRGRGLVDAKLVVSITDSQGRTYEPTLIVHQSEGIYKAGFVVQTPGRHLWSVGAEGSAAGRYFFARADKVA